VTVHFIGIGGAGMSGIARILLARGERVTGSDARESATVLALRALGAEVHIGHDPAQLPDPPATVVVSTAIRESNPELAAARARGLTVEHRSTALAGLTRGRTLAAVTGTAGKTSTTSMLTVALQHCGLDPSFAIGGDLAASGSGAHEGTGDIFVAEADESDASFLAFSPEVAIVTNVEADHLDHYGSPAAYVAAFDEFLGRITPGGTLVTCVDDAGAAALADTARARGIQVRTYGRADGTDARLVAFRPDGAGGRIVLSLDGPDNSTEHRLRLPVPGEHMALNALAALLAGVALGAPAEGLLEGLAGFDGVRRRFEFRGRAAGVAVYDDYAHHPTKVAAQLRAARDVAGAGRVVVAFQPHLYSRTREFAREFGAALGLADEVVVLDVYGAREDPEPGVSGALVAENVPLSPEHVRFVPRWSEVPAVVAGMARSGDLVITMGAGDVTVLAPEILLELSR
jgi:UDP-N-acetylmuramate--alanine ligase